MIYVCLQITRQGQASYAHVHEIIKGLTRRGWELELVQPSKIDIHPASRRRGAVGRAMSFLATQWRAARLTTADSDVVYIRSHFALWPLAAYLRLRHVRTVQEVNGTDMDVYIAWPRMRRFRRLVKWAAISQLRWADHVVAVTPGLREWVELEAGHQRATVIPNGVDSDLFRPKTESSSTGEYAVFVGAFAAWQGIPTVLEAAQTECWPKDTQLVLVGEGECEGLVREVSSTTDTVQWRGVVPYVDVPDVLRQALCALVPMGAAGGRSDFGLSPLKLYEAMSCAIPVIVTDHPGQAELVRRAECGLVIEADDPIALARAVAWMSANRDAACEMGRRGREVVLAGENWDARARMTSELLAEVVGR